MARASVELIIEAANAVNPLKRVTKEAKKVEEGVRDVNGRLRDAKGRFIGAGKGARQASGSFKSLGRNLLKVAAAYGTLAAAQSAVRAGIQRIESQRRLQSLAKGYGEVAALSNAATQASQRFGVSQTTANKAIAQVYARLRPVGVTLKDIVSTYNGFNTAARISGSTAEEASNAFTQLAQALGSGALRGDEFNSISEQVPGILTAISKETGIAQGNLRKFAAEGGITADIVIKALKRIEVEGADQLADALKGPAQAIKDFQNATEEVQVALTQDIVPQIAESFRGLSELILNLKGPINFIGGLLANMLNQANSVISLVTKSGPEAARRDIENNLLPLKGAKELFKGTGPQGRGLEGLREESRSLAQLRNQKPRDVLLELMKNRLAVMDSPQGSVSSVVSPPTLIKPTKTLDKTALTSKARVDASRELVALVEELTFSIDTISEKERLILEHKIAQKRISEQNLLPNQEKIALLELEQRHMEAIISLEEKEAKALAEVAKERREAAMEMVKAGFAQGQAADEQISKLTETEKLANSIGAQLGTGITDALIGAVKGTKDLGEAFQELASDILEAVGKALILKAVTTAIGSVGGGGGDEAGSGLLGLLFREKGGPVSANRPYVVGEKGPELFIPGASGSITNNQQFEAARASMSFYGGGGGTPAYSPNIQATTMPDGMQYVTVEQMNSTVQAGMKVAANQGAAGGQSRTMNALRNSRSQRSKIGLGR